MNIAVDFDGTIVTHKYPLIGEELPFAVETLKMLQKEGHNLVLWSCRQGQLLDDALNWCRERGLEFYAANRDYPEETTDNNPDYTRKLKVDLFIDDRGIGGLPDWGTIYEMIRKHRSWYDLLQEAEGRRTFDSMEQKHKKKWWKRH